ncbi:MAG: sulfate transporter [Alphaproteobacteria bacterium]|nr:sulfate transporter [Alphaproteobacteria bacterium]
MTTAGPARAADPYITVASTTSTDNSGLFRDILPKFEARTGIGVRVVAVGTGAALKLGAKGDADVVLVHARAAEDRFVADGFGVDRRDVMYNDYVVVGPKDDPAGIEGMTDAAAAFARIAAKGVPFSSRGDDSGTNKKELQLWQAAGIDPKPHSGTWYFETGSGMGATLNTAAGRGTYALSDRATWLAFRNRAGLAIAVEGDRRLFNPYGVMLVNPAKHGHVKVKEARMFMDWLTGPAGQAAIAAFRPGGRQLFFPNAKNATN